MKLFGFNFSSSPEKLVITDDDREWVEDSFKWLLQVYGYPKRQHEQIQLTDRYFPSSFSSKEIKLENLIEDMCLLLNLDSKKISFELHKDARDIPGMPYEFADKPFEAQTEILDNHYKIYIANNLIHHPNRLVFSLIYEFIQIRLTESKLQYDTGEDTNFFLYIAGIYFGFGIILSQNLSDIGMSYEASWETKWNYTSDMQPEVMTFALAMYSSLTEQDNPAWIKELPKPLRAQFAKAIELLKTSPSPLFSKSELEADDLLQKAEQETDIYDYDAAIATLNKIISLTNDPIMKSDVYNDIGYCLLRKGNFEKSISYFKNALDIEPNFGFANDNMGYVLIQLGRAEEAKKHLDLALNDEFNDFAYTYRNIALYHIAAGEFATAKEYFKKAFEILTEPVDLLELHYADFLLNQGDMKNGMKYLKEAVQKGEPEAIKRMEELNKK